MRVAQLKRALRFATETSTQLGIADQLRMQKLDGARPLQVLVPGLVDDSDAAFAKRLVQSVDAIKDIARLRLLAAL